MFYFKGQIFPYYHTLFFLCFYNLYIFNREQFKHHTLNTLENDLAKILRIAIQNELQIVTRCSFVRLSFNIDNI